MEKSDGKRVFPFMIPVLHMHLKRKQRPLGKSNFFKNHEFQARDPKASRCRSASGAVEYPDFGENPAILKVAARLSVHETSPLQNAAADR